MKLVVVGLGSIGTRHSKNLENLGHHVIPIHHKDDLKKIITLEKPNAVLVCTPTSKHLSSATITLEAGLPVFIEKPVSHNLNSVDKLKGKILVGYCLRFDQSLRDFKMKIDQLDKTKIKTVKIVAKSWLPDWHPGTDYRQSYSAKKDLGGGVLLDLSHEIDYALWFFGPVKKVTANLTHSPELKIETEANAKLNLEFTSGINAEIQLSYASRQKERYCEIATDSETFRWDFKLNNEMYLDEMKHFIRVVSGEEKPLVTLADGIKILEVIETAKKTNENKE